MPHSPEVAAALEKSIQHWRDNREAKNPRDACTNESACALCDMFNNYATAGAGTDCIDCPVYERTGQSYCQESPHVQAISAIITWLDDPDDDELRDAFSKACDREIAFLESLRDPG